MIDVTMVARFVTWERGRNNNMGPVQLVVFDVAGTTIDDRIHLVTGIGGKGMSTGPGYARHSVERLL
jgi:hypothetical protein